MRPLVHFVLLGALCVVVEHGWRRPVPSAASEQELLYREAVVHGLDRDDDAVRGRLARLGAFVGEDPADEAAVVEAARRLGIDRADVVVRRHLAEMMRLAAEHASDRVAPTDDELAAWMRAHADEVTQPATLRFTQVYLARDRHGARLADDAARLLRVLQDAEVPPDGAVARGDAFPAGGAVGPVSLADVGRRFGPAFAAAVADAPVRTWVGPIASAWGLHLVWIEARQPARLPSLDEVRAQVVHHVLRERGAASTRERLAAMRAGGVR